MTASAYLSGSALLAICVTSLALGAGSIRRRAVPAWSGLPAGLADAVLTLVLLLGVLHLLGSVGLLRAAPVVAGCLVLGIALRAALPVRPDPDERPPPATPAARVDVAVAATACALLAAMWTTGVRMSFDRGIREYDSQWYHLTHAARWVQEGWLTRLHFTTTESPDPFHPGDSELVHALGMLLFDGDVLSPMINVGWLALALAAAWCLGRPWAVGAVTTTAVAVLLATPLFTETQAGTAHNDLAAVAGLLAVAAFLVQPSGGRGRVALAGATAGLALGLKLTVVAPVGVLAIGIPLVAPAGRRLAVAAAWWLPMIATGSFWYLRNLIRSGGNPLPALAIPGLPSPHFAFLDTNGQTVAQHITTPAIWTEWFFPGLRQDLGPLWPVVLAAVALGIAGVWRSGTQELRLFSVAAVAALAAYAVTPTSACCHPDAPGLFALNFRYAYPSLVLGMALLTVSPWARSPAHRRPLLLGSSLMLLVLVFTNRAALPGGSAGLSRLYLTSEAAAAMAVLGVVACAWWARGHHRARPITFAFAACVALLVLGAGLRLRPNYAQTRYAEERWVEDLHARVALFGSDQQYPLYGRDLANRVQYVGRRGPHGEFHDITTCQAFRSALRSGAYDLLVLRPQFALREGRSPEERPELAWAASDAAATLYRRHGPELVYRLDGTSDPAACP